MNEKKSHTAEQEINWVIFAVNGLSSHLPGDVKVSRLNISGGLFTLERNEKV